MLKASELEKAEMTDQLTLAIVGEKKTWKSNIAATGRKPILFLDFDLRSAAIRNRNGVYAIALTDPPHPQPQTVIAETFDILTCIEKSKKLYDIRVGALRLFPDVDPNLELKTIVIDSADSLSRASLNFILSNSPEIRHSVSVAGRFTNYTPNSWTGWVSDVSLVEQLALRCIATGLDTIFILHEAPEEAQDSTEKNPKWTGRVTVYPVRYGRILKNFNDVWRTRMQPDGRGRFTSKVRVAQDWDFNASTCMLGLEPLEDPDITKLIAKHELVTKKQAGGVG